ncbi:MAG: hypothetical protein WCI09_04910 [Planctomycetota bacterium]
MPARLAAVALSLPLMYEMPTVGSNFMTDSAANGNRSIYSSTLLAAVRPVKLVACQRGSGDG